MPTRTAKYHLGSINANTIEKTRFDALNIHQFNWWIFTTDSCNDWYKSDKYLL